MNLAIEHSNGSAPPGTIAVSGMSPSKRFCGRRVRHPVPGTVQAGAGLPCETTPTVEM